MRHDRNDRHIRVVDSLAEHTYPAEIEFLDTPIHLIDRTNKPKTRDRPSPTQTKPFLSGFTFVILEELSFFLSLGLLYLKTIVYYPPPPPSKHSQVLIGCSYFF